MFEAKISKPELMIEAFKAAYELVKDEVTFKIGNEGIILRAMDPANVAMIIMDIGKQVFDSYKLEKESFIGVNMERLMQVIKRAGRTDVMNLKISGGKMEIIYTGKNSRKFSLPLLALESGPRPEPNLSFSVKATVDSELIKEAVEDASVVSDAITFVGANDELHVVAQGDLGDVETILKKGEGIEKIDVTDKARSKYSVDYLRKIAKTKIGTTAGIMFKSDYPLMIQFGEKDVKMGFILAPRMDVE
jgi:proliferating cell nuclear antigen